MKKRNQKIFLTLVLILVAVAGLLLKPDSGPETKPTGDQCTFPPRKAAADLEIVPHAQCRMKCRDISRAILDDTYLHGTMNCAKSEERDGSFRYALEKKDDLGDVIRVIVVNENDVHKIITAIRLDKPDKCDCD